MRFLGQLVGGFILTYLLTRLGLRLTKQMSGASRLLVSHGGVALICGTLYGFGSADGGPFNWSGYIMYAIPAAVWALVDFARGATAEPEERSA